MANLLENSLNPRQVSGAPTIGRGPESGVDYFGDIGARQSVGLRRPQPQARPSPRPRPTGRAVSMDPGARTPAQLDSSPVSPTMRPTTEYVPPMGANSQQSLSPSETASNYFAGGGKPLASPQTVATALQVAGLAVPGLGGVGSLIRGAVKDQESMDQNNERDLSGLVRAPLGLAGATPLGAEAALSAADAARRYSDDDPSNDPSLRTYAPSLANAALSQFGTESARQLAAGANIAMRTMGAEDPGAGGVGTAVKTRAAIDAERAAAEQAAKEAAAAKAARPGIPTPPVGADTRPGGFDNPSFNPDNPNTISALDSVRQFENDWNARNTGGDWGGGAGGMNNSAGSGFGGSSSESRGFAADGGLAVDDGFSGVGMPVQGTANMQMGNRSDGVTMGNMPAQPSVQAQVQRALRDPATVQRLLALPMQLMQTGELTPDEVMTMGRVAEAAMYSPQLYPQLRAFVEEQGMTPLPPAYDPGVIVNIVVIAKALQAQMPATPPGQVPSTGQAQVEQPVPGFGNGGFIRGPGTGRSDSIGTVNESSGAPVKVATDEYIIPAHVVRAKGREFFDNLLRRYDPSQNGGQNG